MCMSSSGSLKKRVWQADFGKTYISKDYADYLADKIDKHGISVSSQDFRNRPELLTRDYLFMTVEVKRHWSFLFNQYRVVFHYCGGGESFLPFIPVKALLVT